LLSFSLFPIVASQGSFNFVYYLVKELKEEKKDAIFNGCFYCLQHVLGK